METALSFQERQDRPIFRVQRIPGKGNGLVALVDIPQGTRILCEKPFLTVEPLSPSALELDLAVKIRALPKEQQRFFFSLRNNFNKKLPFGGIVKTNSISNGPGSTTAGIYATITLLNHSCLPNCHQNWNDEMKHQTVHAIRLIHAGEELTITYGQEGTRDERQDFLKEAFGFECSCNGCSLADPDANASDYRRLQSQDLDVSIANSYLMTTQPEATLANCWFLKYCLNEEFHESATPLLARLYYDAFQICIAHGDQARASAFADLAYHARVICEGEDSPETKKLKQLSQDPTQHAIAGTCSSRWQSTLAMVYKTEDADEFEKWLWKEDEE